MTIATLPQVVLANGKTALVTSEKTVLDNQDGSKTIVRYTNDTDLWFALRGAGSSFGEPVGSGTLAVNSPFVCYGLGIAKKDKPTCWTAPTCRRNKLSLLMPPGIYQI